MNYQDKPWLQWYDPAIPPEIDIPSVTVIERFDEVGQKYPDHPAIVFLGVTITYGEFLGYANRVAQALIQNGIEPGDVVAVNMPNIPQYLIAQVGILKAGCAASGLSPLLTAREMRQQLRDSKTAAIVTIDAIFEHRLREIAADLPDLKLVIGTEILQFLPWVKRTVAKLLKKVPCGKITEIEGKRTLTMERVFVEYPAAEPDVKRTLDDTCLIQYTGGTTGVPKGTIITHRNMVAQLTLVTDWFQMDIANEVILSGFPFFHIAGLALGMGSLFKAGAQILIPDPRNTKQIVKEMRTHRPTMLVNVPSLYMMLLETPGFRDLDFERLKFFLSAASPFPVEAIRAVEEVIGEGKVVEAYGLTEASALATSNPRLGRKKVGSVGLPLPNTRVRLVDLETGQTDVPIGQEGEIAIAGPQIMKGYLNKPEETATALRIHDGEEWLHTGDVARMDEEGYITIVDRSKDMLNVGGFKVFSREVEEHLYEHPAIEFCAIIGVPNPERPGTEIVKLVLQPSAPFRGKDPEVLKAEIAEFSKKNFAPYKIPKIIEITDSIPLTPVGKVDKKALR